jgi:hypothetical protein
MQTIVLNSSNVVPNTHKNTYEYKFPNSVDLYDKEIALSSLSIYYSWFNIIALYDNTTFTYTWIDGTVVNVVLPDGFYSTPDINKFLQFRMVAEGHYLIDNQQLFHYYLEIQPNSTYYAVQINSFVLPAVLPAGWAIPNGNSPVWVTQSLTPQINILNNNFGSVIGFNPGSYPPVQVAQNYSILSNDTPEVIQVTSILVKCSMALNNLNINTGIIYSLHINELFGNLIIDRPAEFIFVPVQTGQYTSFTLQFLDQFFNPLLINDDNVTVNLVVRNRKK